MILRRFAIPRNLSYVDANVLENKNEKARVLCVDALKLDVEKDAEFHLLVERLEEVAELVK